MHEESQRPDSSDSPRTGTRPCRKDQVSEDLVATEVRNLRRYSAVRSSVRSWGDWSAVKKVLVRVTKGDETLEGHVAFLQRLIDALRTLGLENSFESLAKVDAIEPFALRAAHMVRDGEPVETVVQYLQALEESLDHWMVTEGIGIRLAQSMDAHLLVDEQIRLAFDATMVEQDRVESGSTPPSEEVLAILAAKRKEAGANPIPASAQDPVSRRGLERWQEQRVREALHQLDRFERARVPRTQLQRVCGISPTTLDAHIRSRREVDKAGASPDRNGQVGYLKGYVLEYCRDTWKPRKPRHSQ